MDKESQITTVVPDDRVMVQALKYFTTPAQIEALEEELLSASKDKISVKHVLCSGLYARQITVPKGSIIIGHEHAHPCLNVVSSGSASVVLDGKIKRIEAPSFFVSPARSRKIAYVHEDMIWINIHPTKESDIDSLEAKLIIKSEAFKRYELAQGINASSIAASRVDASWADRVDYVRALDDIGISPDRYSEASLDMMDQIRMPDGSGDLFYVGSSTIHGSGIFSAFGEKQGVRIAPACIFGKRTPVMRYLNHSVYPNGILAHDGKGNLDLFSTSDIAKDQEITINYREANLAKKEAEEVIKILTIK